MQDLATGTYNDKISTIEFLNTFFILMVLYLHHTMYTKYNIKLLPEYNLNLYLQKMAVGGFLFLSGFKLTCSKIDDSFGSLFKNRFFKIYIPYLLAVICYSVIVFPYVSLGKFPNYKNIFIHILGIQSIFPEIFGKQYLTLWFISILFICYAFFLLTRKIIIRGNIFIIILAFIIFIIFIIQSYGNSLIGYAMFSNDVIIYLVYFAFGMWYAKYNQIEKISTIILLSAFSLFLICTLYLNTYKHQVWYKGLFLVFSYIISNIAFYIFIFKHFKHLRLSKPIISVIKYISFASFFTFLFHRPIWSIMNFVWYDVSLLHSFYIIIFAPIIIFVGCHRFQSYYNLTISKQ